MTTLEIILIVVICVLLIIVGMIYSGNEDNAKMIDELESENRCLRLEKVFLRPLPNYDVQNYELRIKIRDERIKELEGELKREKNKMFSVQLEELFMQNENLREENQELLTKIALLNGTDGIAKTINGRRVVDDRARSTEIKCNDTQPKKEPVQDKYSRGIVGLPLYRVFELCGEDTNISVVGEEESYNGRKNKLQYQLPDRLTKKRIKSCKVVEKDSKITQITLYI